MLLGADGNMISLLHRGNVLITVLTSGSTVRPSIAVSMARDTRLVLTLVATGALVILASPSDAAAQVSQTAIGAPATLQRGATVRSEYRINPGDELEISVWGEDRMQRTVRVLPDGTFALPLAGTIDAMDRTAGQVSGDIRARIAGNYRAVVPDVSVAVRSTAGMNFYVVGKVRTPGSYTSGRAVDILQALSMAGGLADFADVKHAVILRQTASGQVVEPVTLAKLLKGARRLDAGALAAPLPTLRSGDILVVP